MDCLDSFDLGILNSGSFDQRIGLDSALRMNRIDLLHHLVVDLPKIVVSPMKLSLGL